MSLKDIKETRERTREKKADVDYFYSIVFLLLFTKKAIISGIVHNFHPGSQQRTLPNETYQMLT